MTPFTLNPNEIQQFIMRTFGQREITVVSSGDVAVLIANKQQLSENTKKEIQTSALNKLCGMFENTTLLFSEDFAKNKKYEKELEERKFNCE